jgi:hypothetical protein
VSVADARALARTAKVHVVCGDRKDTEGAPASLRGASSSSNTPVVRCSLGVAHVMKPAPATHVRDHHHSVPRDPPLEHQWSESPEGATVRTARGKTQQLRSFAVTPPALSRVCSLDG